MSSVITFHRLLKTPNLSAINAGRRCLSSGNLAPTATSAPKGVKLGFIGLGHMGSKMVANFARDGQELLVYDPSEAARQTAEKLGGKQVVSSTIEKISSECGIVFSMLPNDEIVQQVSHTLLQSRGTNHFVHISCSTISPNMSRTLLTTHHKHQGCDFIASPVFARPDGLAKREAIWMISGSSKGRQLAAAYLQTLGRIEDLGDEIGAANVVKLCGNFLIASSIEAIGESMALAEKNGVERTRVMSLLSSSIFDCLIYRGYGQRVSQRDHRPGGFSLDLGYKDVSLVNKAARDASVPMPFLSTLVDRYTSAKAKGRGTFDWSAIGLNISEDAGIDVSKDIQRTIEEIKENKTY